jgi:hypothetical protein
MDFAELKGGGPDSPHGNEIGGGIAKKAQSLFFGGIRTLRIRFRK